MEDVRKRNRRTHGQTDVQTLRFIVNAVNQSPVCHLNLQLQMMLEFVEQLDKDGQRLLEHLEASFFIV